MCNIYNIQYIIKTNKVIRSQLFHSEFTILVFVVISQSSYFSWSKNSAAIRLQSPQREARVKNSQQTAIKRIKPRQLIAAVGNNRPCAATSGGQLFLRRG